MAFDRDVDYKDRVLGWIDRVKCSTKGLETWINIVPNNCLNSCYICTRYYFNG